MRLLARCCAAAASVGLLLANVALLAVLLVPGVWPMPLVTPFFPQLVVLALCAWGACIVRGAPVRRVRVASWLLLALPVLGAAALLGVDLGLVVPGLARVAGPARRELSVLACNVGAGNRNPAAVAHAITAADADVVLLTEVDTRMLQTLGAALSRYSAHREIVEPHGDTGIGVWSRHEIVSGGIVEVTPPQIDVVLRVVAHGDAMLVRFLGVHPHAPVTMAFCEHRDATLRLVAARGADLCGQPLLVAGDFNASPYCAAARELARSLGVHDATAGVLRSWPTARKLLPFSTRIDHVWASAHFACVGAERGPFVGSDHFPVLAKLAW